MTIEIGLIALFSITGVSRWFFGRAEGPMWLISKLSLVVYALGAGFVVSYVGGAVDFGNGILVFIGMLLVACGYFIEKEWQGANEIMDAPIQYTKRTERQVNVARVVRGDGKNTLSEKDR